MRILAGRAVLVILGLLSAALIAEVALRVTLDVYECDPAVGWRFARGASRLKISRHREFFQVVEFNDAGFRDVERARERAPGTYRIMVLGDSIPAALQVTREQAFPARIEADLGPGVEVVNAAIDGYGIGQELLLFRADGAGYEPDLVLLFAFPFNDLADNVRGAGSYNHYLSYRCGRPYFERRDGGVAALENEGPVRVGALDRWLGFLRLYSSVYRTPQPAEAPAFRNIDVFRLDRSAAVRDALELTALLIESLDRNVAGTGARLAVVLVPDRYQAGQTDGKRWTLEQRRRAAVALRGRLERAGIPYLDLFEELRTEVDRGGLPYFRHDPHFSPAGHRIVARAVGDWLRAHCAELGLPGRVCGPGGGAAGPD